LQLTYSNEVALLIKIIHGVLGVLLWDGGLHTWTGHCRSLFIAPLWYYPVQFGGLHVDFGASTASIWHACTAVV